MGANVMKIEPGRIAALQVEAERQGTANYARMRAAVDLPKFIHAFERIVDLPISKRAKMDRFLEAASALSDAVKPFTACKAGCSYCCNIAATITAQEATIIAKATGRKARKLDGRVDYEASREQYTGVPCPFLKKGKCSIYEVRPLACRLHVNMADSNFFCNTEVPPGQSVVPQLTNHQILLAQAKVFHNETWADIRDFFPTRGNDAQN